MISSDSDTDYAIAKRNITDPRVWVSKDGRSTPIKDLTNDHLKNIVAMLERIGKIKRFNLDKTQGIPSDVSEIYEQLAAGTQVSVPGRGVWKKGSDGFWHGDGEDRTSNAMAQFVGVDLGTVAFTHSLPSHIDYQEQTPLYDLIDEMYPEWRFLIDEMSRRGEYLTPWRLSAWLLAKKIQNPDFLVVKPKSTDSGLFAAAAIGLTIAGLLGIRNAAKTKASKTYENHTQRPIENQVPAQA